MIKKHSIAGELEVVSLFMKDNLFIDFVSPPITGLLHVYPKYLIDLKKMFFLLFLMYSF